MNKPEEHIIQSLLEKHALGITTPEENAVLDDWYNAFPVPEAVIDKREIKEEMKASIMDTIRPKKVRRMYWQIAAAAVVLVAVATFMLKPWKPDLITVMAPRGKGVMKLELPDHSVVWLQPGSTLSYEGRNMQLLDGMAGFSVTANSDEPFIVSTASGLQVKVLGTAFAVKAFKELTEVNVSVESGAVQIADSGRSNIAVLKADQQLAYNTLTHQYEVIGAVPDQLKEGTYTMDDWKEGTYTLDNASFAELARVLKDQFEADIRYDAVVMKPYRFNIKITRQSTLAEVFDMLHEISGVNYTINGNHVVITGVSQ